MVAAQADGRRLGRIRLERMADTTGRTLESVVGRMIEAGSTVRTDDWKGYNGLARLGYDHRVIRETAEWGHNLLPLVNGVASSLHRWLLGTPQGAVAHCHLDYYLDEFTFRFNRCTSRSRGLLFYWLVQQAVAVQSVQGEELVGGKPGTQTTTNWGEENQVDTPITSSTTVL